MKVAHWLEENNLVKEVTYPGLESFPQAHLARRQMRDFDGDFAPGNMIYFDLDSTQVDDMRFIDELSSSAYSITLAVSLGHTKTLIELPGPMTHSSYGAEAQAASAVRLSIGLESPTDIIGDLDAALTAVT